MSIPVFWDRTCGFMTSDVLWASKHEESCAGIKKIGGLPYWADYMTNSFEGKS